MNHIVVLQFFAQSYYGSDAYGSKEYSSTATSNQTTSTTEGTLADTGMAAIVPISGGVFLIVTALAIIGYRIKRRRQLSGK